jgi:hypothetical protein
MLSEISEGGGLNSLQKYTGQGTCSHIHFEAFLGNMRCFWDNCGTADGAHLVVGNGAGRAVLVDVTPVSPSLRSKRATRNHSSR